MIFLSMFFLAGCGSSASIGMDNDGDMDGGQSQADGDSSDDIGPDYHGVSCLSDDDCPAAYACDPDIYKCREIECETSADCGEDPDAVECTDSGLCIAAECSSLNLCPDDYYCTGGRCAPLPGCNDIVDITINSLNATPPLLSSGTKQKLEARAVLSDGSIISGHYAVIWQSLNEEVVSIQWDTGKSWKATAFGGSVDGATSIVATLQFKQDQCVGHQLSTTLSLQNFALLDSGLRVIVTDGRNNNTLGGATVIVNGQSMITPIDADRGVVIFEDIKTPYDVHVFHPDFHYLSLMGLALDEESLEDDEDKLHDIVLPLQPFYGVNQKAGIVTELNFSRIPSILHHDTYVAMAGMGFTRSLLDLNLATLFSGAIMTAMPFQGPFHDEIPLPSNVKIVSDEVASNMKLYVEGDPGSTTSWGFGGYLPATDFMELVLARLHEGWSDVGAFLLSAMHYSGNFYHGFLCDIQLEAWPMVPDNGEHLDASFDRADLNGNDLMDDYIPDYDNFKISDKAVALKQTMNRRLHVTLGQLPRFAQEMNGVFTLAGARSTGNQFIPLGVGTKEVFNSGLTDKPSAGKGGDLWMTFSPNYGAMDQTVSIIAFSLPFGEIFSESEDSLSFSAILREIEGAPEELEMGDFLEFVLFADIIEDQRRIEFTPVLGEEERQVLHRLTFTRDGRNWEVYVGDAPSELELVKLDLPTPPGDDPFGPVLKVTAAEMTNFTSDGISAFDDLAQLNDKYFSQLDRYIRRYSVYHFDKKRR